MEWYDNEIKTKKILSFNECSMNQGCVLTVIKCYEMSLTIYDNRYAEVFQYILSQILHLTQSEIGGICEKVTTEKEDFLKFISLSESTNEDLDVKFHSIELDNLLGRGITHEIIVVSNDLKKDTRAKGLPKSHFKMNNFMGIPLIKDNVCIGQIILANKRKNYVEGDLYTIYPLIKMCTDMIFNICYKQKYTITEMLQVKSDIKKAKDDFLATMSHEIRTPLTGIMGAITLIPQVGILNEKQQQHIKIATTCSVQLLDQINAILDFSRLSSNTLTLTSEPFPIRECIEESVLIINSRAALKGIELCTNVDPKIPESVIGDSKRLKQVLVNLLSNAVKFTEQGKITINVSARPYSENDSLNWKIAFDIRDTGIGIKPSEKKKLFKVFSQLEDQTAYKKQDGAGLGLAISKELVELMGGKIKVESSGLNKGSTFSFYINVEEDINIESILEKYSNSIKNISILNVDDKMENLLILDEMLYRWGLNSIMCNSAEQALRYLEKGQHFDLAIIDICMPYMSGIELAQRLRENNSSLPLIGISSIGQEVQGSEWFDVYLIKPYNHAKILKSIITCLTKTKDTREIYVSNLSQIEKKEKKDLKILLADDDNNTQFMIKEMILMLGYVENNIKIVSNGQQAVDAVKAENFDVCLMDIKMPIMDGLEASKHIRQMTKRPSIIAVSAGVMDSDKNSCLKAGMDGYLGKPFTPKELDTVLQRFIQQR